MITIIREKKGFLQCEIIKKIDKPIFHSCEEREIFYRNYFTKCKELSICKK